MKNEEIFRLLENQKNDVKDLFAIHNTAIRGKIESEIDRVDYKLNNLINYQKTQNNNVSKLMKEQENIKEEIRIFRLIHRNPKTATAIIILVILGAMTLPFVNLLNKIF